MASHDTPTSSPRGPSAAQGSSGGLGRFLISRWRGEVPLGTVFWRDMIVIGTGLNLLTGMTGMILLAGGAPTALAMAVYFSLLPWNLFLVNAVWRSARHAPPSEATIARFGSLLWLPIAILI